MRTIYAVPEYIISKHIPEQYAKNLPKIDWKDAYKYRTEGNPTVSELAKVQGCEVFDTALPLEWVREFEDKTGFNPVGHFVMDYTDNTFGLTKPITREGEVAAKIYNHIVGKIKLG